MADYEEGTAGVPTEPENPNIDGATAEPGDYTGPKGNTDLPEVLVDALRSICRKMDQRELQARLNQVARAQKGRLFQRGIQYLRMQEVGGTGVGGTIYAPINPDQETDQDKMYVFNIYLGYQKSFVATFAQAPAGVRFEANDPMISSDVEAAREAESAKRIIGKVNYQKDLQKKIARLLWTDGKVVLYCSSSTKGARLGYDKDGSPRPYPSIEVGGDLEWKVPIACGEFEDWDYVRRQREISLSVAKENYPEKAEALSAGSSSKDVDYSRQARVSVAEGLGIQTQTGDALASIATESCYWLRPSAFHEAEDKTLRGELKDWFPNGCYVCFVGENYVASRDESMDDHIEVLKAIDGEGFNTPGLGDSAIGPQESFNDGMNLAQVTFMRGVPHSFFDEKLIPPDARKNQKSRPGEAHPVERPPSDALANCFYQESPAEAPATLVTYLDNVQGPLTQFLTGQQPALFGGEMGEAGKTASGYQQALAQAMGLMGLVWVPFKKSWANVMRMCVAIFGNDYEDSEDPISTTLSENNGSQTTVTVNPKNLKGSFLCYPDTDENFPESHTAKQAAYTQVRLAAKDDPALQAILDHPDNQRLGKDLMGLQDMTIPGADSCEKQMKEIEDMEKQPPVPDPQAVALIRQSEQQGAQVPPEQLATIPQVSSVDIDPDFDDHQSEFETCVRWINSPAGQKAKVQTPQWFQNVRLHAMAHKKQLQQNQGDQKKPPSESINLKDLPPSGKVQMAAQAGIHLDPNELAAQEVAKQQPLAQ